MSTNVLVMLALLKVEMDTEVSPVEQRRPTGRKATKGESMTKVIGDLENIVQISLDQQNHTLTMQQEIIKMERESTGESINIRAYLLELEQEKMDNDLLLTMIA
jgi:hypothetical protein